MRLPSRLLVTALTFTLTTHALRRDDAGAAPDVSLRSSAKTVRAAKDGSGVFVVNPGTRVVAQLPCLGCPPISSAAEDEPTILLFHLNLNPERTALLVDSQHIYPSSDLEAPLPTMHARQWPATLAKEDISGAIEDFENEDEKDNPFSSDYVTLAYRRTIFPIAGSSATIIQLDVLGVGNQIDETLTTIRKSGEDKHEHEHEQEQDSEHDLQKKELNTHAGTPLDSDEQKMIQLLVRRDVATGTLSIARVDIVSRLPIGRIVNPDRPSSSATWTNRILDAFGGPADDAFTHGSTAISTGGLTAYFTPPTLSESTSHSSDTVDHHHNSYAYKKPRMTVGTWFRTYWIDLAILFSTLTAAILLLYIIYLIGTYLRQFFGLSSSYDYDYDHLSHYDTSKIREERTARMLRLKRHHAAGKGNLERVLEEGTATHNSWDEKRRSWNGSNGHANGVNNGVADGDNASTRSVSGGYPGNGNTNANGNVTRERRSNSMPLVERREVEATRRPLSVKTGKSAEPGSGVRRKTMLPPTPVESWEAGSGLGWGWGER